MNFSYLCSTWYKLKCDYGREKIAAKKLSNLKCIDINPHSSPGKVMMFVKPTRQHTLEIRMMLMNTNVMMMNTRFLSNLKWIDTNPHSSPGKVTSLLLYVTSWEWWCSLWPWLWPKRSSGHHDQIRKAKKRQQKSFKTDLSRKCSRSSRRQCGGTQSRCHFGTAVGGAMLLLQVTLGFVTFFAPLPPPPAP